MVHTFIPMRFVAFLLLMFLSFWPGEVTGQKNSITLVIDPGHGGNDPGHLSESSTHLTEKELNLKIAQFLGGYIEKYLKNIRVVYTRTGDAYPSLNDRVGCANNNNADYFISVHCNGNDRKAARGTESHVHSLSLSRSVALATEIEQQFSKRAGRKSRGVKDVRDLQHSLQVLKYTNMPSVLVECGFMTNPKEARFLNTTYGQEIIASAIFRALRTTIVNEHPSISFVRNAPELNLQYSIQIMSSRVPVATDQRSFKKLKMEVRRKELNTTRAYKYIYTVGDYNTREDAQKELDLVRTRGFKDAMVIQR